MTSAMMLDFIRIRTDAEAAANDDLVMNLILTDTGERFAMKRLSGVVLVYADCIDENAAATVTCERAQLFSIMQGSRDILETTVIEGDESVIDSVTRYMTVADPYFNIIEP